MVHVRARAQSGATQSGAAIIEMTEFEVAEGTLPGALPYFRLGSGPRLVVCAASP
jgi:hypothetical protein